MNDLALEARKDAKTPHEDDDRLKRAAGCTRERARRRPLRREGGAGEVGDGEAA